MQNISVIALIAIMVSSLVVFILENFRHRLIAMIAIYLSEFILVALVWPIGLALIKFIIGTICIVVLFTVNYPEKTSTNIYKNVSYQMLKAVVAILIWLIVFYFSNRIFVLIPTNQYLLKGSLTLIGLGIIQVGFISETKSVIIGLLMFFAGFEILHSAIEASVLLAGLLASVNLGLSVAGAYLLSNRTEERIL